MIAKHLKVAVGFVAGLMLGAFVLTAFAQNAPRSSSVPRYSVQWESSQKLLLITDNSTNRLYLYSNGKQGSQLSRIIDLRQTGATLLRATTPSRKTAPKAKTKANPKKKGKKKGKKAKASD